MIAFDVDTADCTTLPKLGARSTASGEDDELRVESGESATCTVTAGARLAEALRKRRDVNEPEVSSDMAAQFLEVMSATPVWLPTSGAERVCAQRVRKSWQEEPPRELNEIGTAVQIRLRCAG